MAASRSARQLAEIGKFVEALYELGGYKTWKEFATDAGISAPQVSDFKTGSAEPSGYNLLRLIQAAAARAAEEPSAAAVRVAQETSQSLLADIQSDVATLLMGQAEAFEKFDKIDALLRREPAEQKPPVPKPKGAARKGAK